MLATIVVGHLGEGVDRRDDLIIVGLGHRKRGQGQAAAQALGVIHGAETAEHPALAQALQAVEQVALGDVQLLGHRREGACHQRQAILQAVDQATIDAVQVIEGHAAPSRT